MQMTKKKKYLREAIVLQKTKTATKMGRIEIINGKVVKLYIFRDVNYKAKTKFPFDIFVFLFRERMEIYRFNVVHDNL